MPPRKDLLSAKTLDISPFGRINESQIYGLDRIKFFQTIVVCIAEMTINVIFRPCYPKQLLYEP